MDPPLAAMMSAATPETCGAAMLVPAAQPTCDPPVAGVLKALKAMSKTQQNCTTTPVGKRGTAQTSLPGRMKSPPGAAKLITLAPKFEYDARLSRLVFGLMAQPTGPVAEMARTCGSIAGKSTVSA